MMKKIVFLFILSCVVVGQIKAQKEEEATTSALDSMRKKQDEGLLRFRYNSKFIKTTNEQLLRDSIVLLPLDTVQNNFRFLGNSIIPTRPIITIGGYGLAQRALLFEPDQQIGLRLGRNTWDAYMLYPSDIQYYKARVSYSEITYVSSGNLEEIFKAKLAQNINRYWNWGLNFNRIGGDGFFARQNVGIINGALFTWYHSPKNRYQLLSNICFNTYKAQENGGLVVADAFDPSLSFSKRAIQSNLESALHNNKQNSWYIKQSFRLGTEDTSHITVRRTQRQQISHSLLILQQEYGFTNSGEQVFTVFQNYYLNTSTTNDYTKLNHVQNDWVYDFLITGKKFKNELNLSWGIQHDWYELRQLESKKQFQNISLKGRFNYRFSQALLLNAELTQITIGENYGDYKYDFTAKFALGNHLLNLYAKFVNQSPLYLYQHQMSNNLIWQNNFEKTQINLLKAEYAYPKIRFKLGTSYYLINNYTYLKTDVTTQVAPYQDKELINFAQVYLQKDFLLWRFHLDNLIYLQASNQLDILATPKFYSRHSCYYADTYFKVLHTQIGTDISYHSKYYNPSYIPNIGQFYTSTEKIMLANVPIWDVWISFIIKKANIFVKYEYLNQGIRNQGYYLANAYPMPDSMIRYGIIWRFYE